jgi:hypothetical protein
MGKIPTKVYEAFSGILLASSTANCRFQADIEYF